jgi:myo-inositol-1(or 4)-monophosphatase
MLSTAIQAVKRAARITTKYFSKPTHFRYKNGQELVTEVDAKAEQIIRKTLASRFRHHGFLGEESGSSASSSVYLWIADPIEGTVNFSRGIHRYAISLALARGKHVLLGVVYNPITNELFTAKKEGGAYLNGKRIHVSKRAELFQAVIYATALHKSSRTLRELFKKVRDLRIAESSAYENSLIACGKTEAFIKITTHPWGFAAANLIVEEAGGRVTNFDGSPWSIHSTKLLASNGILHEDIRTHLVDIQK